MWDSIQSLFQPTTSPLQLYRNLALALIGSFVLLALLHRFLGPRGRRWLIALVTFVSGLYLGLEYFLPVRKAVLWPTAIPNPNPDRGANLLTPGIEPVGIMMSVIGAFTVGLGIYSLCQVHGRNLGQRRPGWYNSLALFLAMVAMLVFGFWAHYLPKAEATSAAMPAPRAIYEMLFRGLFMPLQAATFSLLAFYIASAAYRAFRIRTAEAGLMMGAAFIVMLAQVPIGAWLTSGLPVTGALAFFRLEALGEWIMTWLNAPAQRGIVFGVAIGGLAMSLRIWLSLERGTFFSEQG
jgi:hypothetical protein